MHTRSADVWPWLSDRRLGAPAEPTPQAAGHPGGVRTQRWVPSTEHFRRLVWFQNQTNSESSLLRQKDPGAWSYTCGNCFLGNRGAQPHPQRPWVPRRPPEAASQDRGRLPLCVGWQRADQACGAGHRQQVEPPRPCSGRRGRPSHASARPDSCRAHSVKPTQEHLSSVTHSPARAPFPDKTESTRFLPAASPPSRANARPLKNVAGRLNRLACPATRRRTVRGQSGAAAGSLFLPRGVLGAGGQGDAH